MSRELRSAKIIISNTAVMLAFLVLLVASNLLFMNKMNNDLVAVDNHESRKLYLVLQIEEIIRQRSLSMMAIYLSDDIWFRDSEYLRFHEMAATFITLRNELLDAGLSQEEKTAFNSILQMIKKTEPLQDNIVEQLRYEHTPKHLRKEISEVDMPLEYQILQNINDLTERIRKNGQQARLAARKNSITTLYIDVLASGLVLISLFLLMRNSLSSLRNIESELIDKTESLGWDATHDHLTQTLNRRGLHKRFKSIVENTATGDQHSLIFIDLDDFKTVNDKYGHDVGDELLCRIAELFQTCIRRHDTIARIGGDEFALILEHSDLDTANRISHCLLDKAKNFGVTHNGDAARIKGCSIGIHVFTGNETDLDELIKLADSACYNSKRHGKNQLSFSSLGA